MKDLVLEAVKAFPVWPEGATHIVTTCPAWAGRSELQDTFEPSYDGRDKNGSNFLFGREAWQIACTREQHIRKRIELFEGAPEGVTHTADTLFYKKTLSCTYVYCYPEWFKSENAIDWLDKHLIPRPTPEELAYIAEIDSKNKALDDVADTDVGEWVPEVGQKALLLNEDDYRIDYGEHIVGKEVTVLSVFENSSGIAVAAVEFEENGYCFRVSMLHEPKTEAEKERELLEEKMYRDAQLADCVNFTKAMAKVLIAAGWRPSND